MKDIGTSKPASNKINFTKPALQNIEPPLSQKRISLWDTQIKGLLIDVRASGSKSFYVYKKIKGRPEKIFLGAFPDLSIENARKLAQIKLGEIAFGKNPQDEKRKFRRESTLGHLFDEYMNRYSKKHKKSWKYDEREIKKYLSHWFNRKISDILKNDVQKLVEKIHDENGLYQANRILERIRALYNKAIKWGWEGRNPSFGIDKYKEKSRDRFILPSEMPCFLKSLNEESNTTARDFFLTLLLTGARRTNTLEMRWEQINWTHNLWKIPTTKNGQPAYVPLVNRMVDLLKNRQEHSKSAWVFANGTDDTKRLVNFKRAWKRTLQKATIYIWLSDEKNSRVLEGYYLGVEKYKDVDFLYKRIVKRAEKMKVELSTGLMDLRLHDIRRTFGSYQAINGASLQIIGESLGHKSIQSTQVYARLMMTPVRTSVETATKAMFDI